jgi:hypothetical protein
LAVLAAKQIGIILSFFVEYCTVYMVFDEIETDEKMPFEGFAVTG